MVLSDDVPSVAHDILTPYLNSVIPKPDDYFFTDSTYGVCFHHPYQMGDDWLGWGVGMYGNGGLWSQSSGPTRKAINESDSRKMAC